MSLFQHLFLPHHTNNQRAKILHPSSWAVLIIAFAAFQLFLGQATRSFPQILGYASRISPAEIIRLTNIQRQSTGLNPVNEDPQLDQAAARKAADMFARDYWAHVSPIGTEPWAFISDAGYVYRYAGENLARDFSDPNSVVTAWMNSPSHRDNLLSTRYVDVGVAVVDGTLGGRDTTLVVQMFGARLAANPSVQTAGSFTVQAQTENPPVGGPTPTYIPIPTSTPPAPQISGETRVVSPFALTKYLSLAVLGIITLVLVADVVTVSRRKVVRWTSKSIAHLIFLIVILIAAATILRGQII